MNSNDVRMLQGGKLLDALFKTLNKRTIRRKLFRKRLEKIMLFDEAVLCEVDSAKSPLPHLLYYIVITKNKRVHKSSNNMTAKQDDCKTRLPVAATIANTLCISNTKALAIVQPRELSR